MERFHIDGVDLEYEIRGSGEPVVLIHGAHIADAMIPLLDEPAVENFRFIHYHRRGFAGSTRPPGPTSIETQADDVVGLLDHLGLDAAHVVGHSLGAVIAIELAARHSARVSSLALLEPALLSGPAGAVFAELIEPIVEQYRGGDAVGAVHAFLDLIGGPACRETIARAVPGGVHQAEQDAATFFEIELPAIEGWTFGPERARAIACPVLSVLGTASGPLFAEGRELLHVWLAECQDADIADSTHLLQMEATDAVGEAVGTFLRSIQGAPSQRPAFARQI